MQNTDFDRLVGCFRQVFTDLTPAQIPGTSVETTAAWDSIAHITLLNLVQEEFGIEIDLDEFDKANSFTAMLELIRARTAK
jgi:acyl carrier protein